jgi:membrane-bound ClpP family serine protease
MVMSLATTLLVSQGWDFVTHPAVMTILLTIGFVGIFVELLAPGHIFPGIIGIGAFVLYFFGQNETGVSSLDAPLIFIVGLVLLIIELFVPGGIFGILGTIALFYSVVAAAENVETGLMALAIGIVAAILFLWILYRFFGFRTSWNRIILTNKQENNEGYTTSKDRRHLIGKTGVAITTLRPAGWAKIEGQREDVVSEGDLIPDGATIIVTNVEGTRVVVKKSDIDD